jgi:hypothetical protein
MHPLDKVAPRRLTALQCVPFDNKTTELGSSTAFPTHWRYAGELELECGQNPDSDSRDLKTSMSDPNISSFIWSVADLLRGDNKQSEYGKVILPFTVLRRLDGVLKKSSGGVLSELALREKSGLNPVPFLALKMLSLGLKNATASQTSDACASSSRTTVPIPAVNICIVVTNLIRLRTPNNTVANSQCLAVNRTQRLTELDAANDRDRRPGFVQAE